MSPDPMSRGVAAVATARHHLTVPRRSFVVAVLLALLLALVPPVPGAADAQAAPELDLEALTGPEAIAMMEAGTLTSVELTLAYLDRIEAINKSGPGLNAVTQLSPTLMADAARADAERAAGIVRGPAHGLPILLKDLIDVEGMYTSAGNYSLRNSFPETDSGVAKKLKESGVVIMGKVGLSEYANYFGSQPSGFANLTGQVLNALDTDSNPSGSSSGTATAAAAAMSSLTIGTETSGSILSPSRRQGIVGLRPTVGLVPGYGIAPIFASQDTAGPMTRTVAEAAMVLQSIAGPDPLADAGYASIFGPDYLETGVIPTPPETVPDYMSAMTTDFVDGKRVGYSEVPEPGTPLQQAYDALVDAGAIMVFRPETNVQGPLPSVPSGYEAHLTINSYYDRLGPDAPIKSMAEEIAANDAESHQALKFGNSRHESVAQTDITPGGANEAQFRANLPQRKAAYHKAIDDMMTYTDSDPTLAPDPVIAILGDVPSGAQAGYPEITIPMGYRDGDRRPVTVEVQGAAYDERDLLGVAYVIEQATLERLPASTVNPSIYRCADTVPAPPFAARGDCNPTYDAVMEMLGGEETILDFSLETESAAALADRMDAGTLTSEDLTSAYLTRIALANAEGPAIQAVRSINPSALADAAALDDERASTGSRGPLHGIPVIVNDSIDVAGMPTTAGSIALQDSVPDVDSDIVANLRAAGAVILGKANVSELNGVFSNSMPDGYSSLGGQVLLASDADNSPDGSSGGAAAAAATGMAALTIGMETSPDSAELIEPAAVAGVVGFKPSVGLVSGQGVLPVAESQDSFGPIGQTVEDVATGLDVLVGSGTDYADSLSTDSLAGRDIAIVGEEDEAYTAMVAALQAQGATTIVVTPQEPAEVPDVVLTEFSRDVDAYLAGVDGGAGSLDELIATNLANPEEGLMYQQGLLEEAAAIDLGDPDTMAAYSANLAAGKAGAESVIDRILEHGTPADTRDDFDLVVVPTDDDLVGLADRAGYPVLTVPAGFAPEDSSNGRNPIGVALIGPAGSDATVLAHGHALEQESLVRMAPSFTNPSMWRCVPGSTFFTAELCHPGDLAAPPLPTAPAEGDMVITVTVPAVPDGEFVWTVTADGFVDLGEMTSTGTALAASGPLDPILVSDTRPGGPSWSIAGQVGDFDPGGPSGAHLGWTPTVIDPGAGATAGPSVASGIDGGDGLSVARVMAAAAPGHPMGTARVGADLDLQFPVETDPGAYTAIMTITALS